MTGSPMDAACYDYAGGLNFATGFLQPVSFWMLWQFSYVYFQFVYLDKHPDLVISQRYLVADGRKTLAKYGYRFGIYLGKLAVSCVGVILYVHYFCHSIYKISLPCLAGLLLFLIGLFDPNHLPPDPFAKKTTMAFVLFSMCLMPSTMLPPLILFDHQTLNLCFLIMVSLSALWNGATYYIHIFSQRYNEKFDITNDTNQDGQGGEEQKKTN